MESTLWQLLEGMTVDGKYRLHKLLGAGSHGGVFDAEPLADDRELKHVAVKLAEPVQGREDQQLQEIAGLAGLSHPSLLRSFTPGHCTLNGIRFIYLPSEMADETLSTRISVAPISLDEARDVGIAVASALTFLHEQPRPLVHRDVKPANIMRIGARWKLGDFSLLRSVSSNSGLRTRSFAGTAEYAPPESYDGLISPAWDIWSLGILLHEAVTGSRPFYFQGETPQQIMNQVCTSVPNLSANLPPDFLTILRASLDKDPTVRWTGFRMLDALESLDSAHNVPAPAPLPRRRAPETPTALTATAPHRDVAPIEWLTDQITVSTSGEADCSTLVEAVRRAPAGASIRVAAGFYSGPLLLERPVEIVGEGSAEVVVECAGHEVLIIDSESVRISGMTLISRSDMHQPKHNGVVIRSAGVQIEDCDISCSSLAAVAVCADIGDVVLRRCTVHDGKTAGVLFEDRSSCVLEDCQLVANFGPAIHIKAGGTHTVRSCDVFNGRESGIVIDRSASASIEGCSIYENEGAGVILQESGTATIYGCAIYGNKHAGVSARAKSKIAMTDCDVCTNVLSGAAFSGSDANLLKCRFHDSRSNGISISDGAKCTMEDSEVDGNGFAGIKVSHAGKLTAMRCALHSGKRNAAVIQDDGSAAFVNCDIHANGLVGIQVEEGGRGDFTDCSLHDCLEGGVLYAGSGTMERCTLVRNGKPAVECKDGGNITLRDCAFESNEMPGVLIHGKSEAVIEHCLIAKNGMPGIAIGESSKALVSECTVSLGEQVGVVFWDHAKGIVDRCEIRENKLDGIRIIQGSDPMISASQITLNGHYGIHVSGQSAGHITDCTLSANTAGPAFVEAGCTTQSSGNTV